MPTRPYSHHVFGQSGAPSTGTGVPGRIADHQNIRLHDTGFRLVRIGRSTIMAVTERW